MRNNAFEQYTELANKLVALLKDINYYVFPKFDAPDCPIKEGEVVQRVTDCRNYITDRIEKINSKRFTICIIGTFSSGKSTLINSILGRHLLPESLDVTTMCPTRIKAVLSSTEEFAKVFYLTDSEIYQLKHDIKTNIVTKISDNVISMAEKKQLMSQGDSSFISRCQELEEQKTNIDHSSVDKNLLKIFKQMIASEKQFESKLGKNEDIPIQDTKEYIANQDLGVFIRWVELHIHTDIIPPDIEIIDLPGLSVSNPWHEKVTKEQMDLADSIIFCTHSLKSFDKSEEDALDKMSGALTTITDKTFWVLNQWDLIKEESQRNIVIDRFYKIVGKYNIEREKIKLYRTSALYGLIAKLQRINDRQLARYDQLVKEIEKQYGQLDEQVCKRLLDISEIDMLSEDIRDHLDNKIRITTLSETRNRVVEMVRFIHAKVYNTYESEIRIISDTLKDNKIKDIETEIKRELEKLISGGKGTVNNIIDKINKLEFGHLYAITPNELWDIVTREYLSKEVNLQQVFLNIMGENKYRKNPIYYEVEYKLLDSINIKVKLKSIETLRDGILKVFEKFEEDIKRFKTDDVERSIGAVPEITSFFNQMLDTYRDKTASSFADTAGVEVSELDELLNWKGEKIVTFNDTFLKRKTTLESQFQKISAEFIDSYRKRFGLFGENVITAERLRSLLKSVEQMKYELETMMQDSIKSLEEVGGQPIQELIEIAKIHPRDYTDHRKWQEKQEKLMNFLTKYYKPALERFVEQLNQYVRQLVTNKLMDCREEIEKELRKTIEPKLRSHIQRQNEDKYVELENEHKRKRDKLGQLHDPLKESLENLMDLELRIVISEISSIHEEM